LSRWKRKEEEKEKKRRRSNYFYFYLSIIRLMQYKVIELKITIRKSFFLLGNTQVTTRKPS
jgi:hypothetical protein